MGPEGPFNFTKKLKGSVSAIFLDALASLGFLSVSHWVGHSFIKGTEFIQMISPRSSWSIKWSSQSSQSVFSRKCLGFQKMPASLKFARVSRKCQTIQKILELFAFARIFFFEFVRISRKAKFTSVEPICVMKSLSGYSSLYFSVPAICSSLCSHNYITSL